MTGKPTNATLWACDGPGCGATELSSSSSLPMGWIRVYAMDPKDGSIGSVCSVGCLKRWAGALRVERRIEGGYERGSVDSFSLEDSLPASGS